MNKSGRRRTESPIVSEVLDRFLASLKDDKAIENQAAIRLDKLLRTGVVPTPIAIDRAIKSTDPTKP